MNIFENSTLVNILFLFLALFGILLTLILYFRSKKYKHLVYDIITIPVFKYNVKNINKIKIIYNQTEVNTLTLTKLSICNLGSETILRKDIVQNEPIQIEFPECTQILDSEIVSASRKAINGNIKLTDLNKISIDFDFLDKNDGFVLNIIHGNHNGLRIIVKGIIIGDKNKAITKYIESSFIEWLTENIISNILPKNRFGEILVAIILFPILLPILAILYSLELSFKLHKSLPKEFRISFK